MTRKKKVLPALMSEAEALVPKPRELALPQYEDCNGEKHFEEQDAVDANRRVVLTSLVERDLSVNGENNGDLYAEDIVALIERNMGALRITLHPFLKKETVDKAFGQFMNRKFGKDWRDKMIGDESKILVRQMQDAYTAGAEAD